MANLETKITKIFSKSTNNILDNNKCFLYNLVSNNLVTKIFCSSRLCFDNLKKLTLKFNTSSKISPVNNTMISIFITEDKETFKKIDKIFNDPEWLCNEKDVKLFNIATKSTSKAKYTSNKIFYIIKCYDYFYYLYNKKEGSCLIVINNKKAVSMINILLLTPYLLCGDLYAIHGNLVSNGKNNILISANSLGGKTTFALLFLENGWQIVTEETTYIKKSGDILDYNIRNYFNIRIGTYLEFKDLFLKKGIINNDFLKINYSNKSKLFEIGKRGQISVFFEDFCKNNGLVYPKVTHFLEVCIKKDISGIIVKRITPMRIINKFLEISFAPTVMLFKNIVNIKHLNKTRAKKDLLEIFKNVKSYSIITDLDYRNHFKFLLNKII